MSKVCIKSFVGPGLNSMSPDMICNKPTIWNQKFKYEKNFSERFTDM